MSVSTVLNRWLKRLYKLLAILLVAFAVLISTLRLFLPYAHNYRQDVEDYLNTSYSSNISIGALSMGWRRSGPTLITQQVELLSSDDSKIYIESLEVKVDFWRSIRSGQLVTEDFVISGAELAFEQAALANSTEELSINEAGEQALVDSLSSILLEQISRFSIRDSHVLFHSVTGTRAFTINEMFWVNDNDRHRANGSVIVDGLSSNNLKVLLDFQGSQFDNLSGRAYFEANDIDITPWLGRYLAIEDADTHSAINFSAWLKIADGQPELIQVGLGDNEITWQHQDKTQSFEIIGGDIEINTVGEIGLNVSTSPLTIKRNGVETNQISLLANVVGTNINGYINAIELASFEGISPLLFDDIGLEKLLLDLDAVGRVKDIHFRSSPDDLAITATLSDVDSHFSHGIPGIDNVSGELVYLNNQLQISLNAVDGALDFAEHFKYPIPYTQLSSLINVQFLTDGWQLSVENVAFTSPQLTLNADLQISSVKDSPITMALLASASKGNAKFAEYFYPHLLMGQDLVNYLNSAIVDGEINQALVLFNGPLQSFPFNNHEGIFVVDAELSNSIFKFDPQWPAIKNFAANLNFTNNSMLITGRDGTLSGIDVTGVEAAIADLSDGQVLTVDASFIDTKPQLVQQLMNASPMQDTVGVTLEQVTVSDVISGDFSLILPLNAPDAVVAKGYVDFKNNSLSLQTPNMDFSQVKGRLNYHNDKISAQGVELNWRGMPLTLNVVAEQKTAHYNVSIDTLAQWQDKHWQAQLSDQLVKYGQGNVAWQGLLSLNISDEKFTYDYQVNSDLNAVSLAVPAPFDKKTAEPMAVTIHAFGDKSNSTIKAEIGDKINFYGVLDHQQTRFSLAHLVLGQQQSWAPTSGFHITADVEQANYQQWQPLVLDIMAAVATKPSELAELGPPSEQSVLDVPNKIHGEISNLMVFGESFQHVSFDFSPEPDWWLLKVNAKELRGTAKFYPDWHQQGIDISADFVHLKGSEIELLPHSEGEQVGDNSVQETENAKLKALESTTPTSEIAQITDEDTLAQQQKGTDSELDSAIDPTSSSLKQKSPVIDNATNAALFADIPPLNVNCTSCRYGAYDFGEVSFSLAREHENTLLMKKFIAQRDKNKMVFEARWQQDSNSSKTEVTGTLIANNVAREVEQIGYASIIKDSGVEMNYNLAWQGAPYDFALANFNGEVATIFDDGYLADVDDKGVRILSFLSLQSLVRKLSFDFRDIFSDGMFYRELKGNFTVKDGVAYTDNVLMKGTAGDLSIKGNTNLNNGALDYRMSYKPNLTSSLPVLAWIATLNPVTFLAGVALDEVITSTVISEINFEVTGNIDEPQFKQVSRKNQNISVGRSSPPKIIEGTPDSALAPLKTEKSKKSDSSVDNIDG